MCVKVCVICAQSNYFFAQKKKAKGGRQRVCTQCVIKIKFFYLMHECYKRPNMIYQFMSQNEV